MGQQWLREWSLVAGGVTCGGDLRVVFDIKSSINYQPVAATICVYNLDPSSAKSFLAAKTAVFSAGYQGSTGTIFSGDVKWVNLGKENSTDTTATIFAAAGDVAHNTSVANRAFKAGSTAMDHFTYLLSTMNGIQAGNIPTAALQAIKYPRAVTMFGMAKTFIHNIALSVGGIANYDATASKLHITQNNDPGSGSPLVVNRSTGMIGLPTQTTNGINVRILLNPTVTKNSLIHLDDDTIQGFTPDLTYQGQVKIGSDLFQGGIDPAGIYRVVGIEHVGDSRGAPWFCELNCIAQSGSGTQSQLRSGRG